LSSIDLILSALDLIVTEALTALAKPEEILPFVFSSVCNWGIYHIETYCRIKGVIPLSWSWTTYYPLYQREE
jgi:hypothetical protein